ncbi:MAG: bifunctional hydroxymethylpyrimidine kinase/phosphomethylpyrimidine kinase [Oligoflexia bacterium]|nr:bifunctional hydroxymethylpyrimidine kinase/phosphomethylpyrimidine kinase [Oligoflexia bacterium]
MGQILVVGSLAYDSVKTPSGEVNSAIGGSANYFGLSASLFAPVRVVGVVGNDYAEEHSLMLTKRGVDVSGVQKVEGKTFHWAGEYSGDMNEAKTLKTELNVFANFQPTIPENYKDSDYVFLANIDPVLQMEVLKQVRKPKLVAADTMNFWIQSKKNDLINLLKHIDILVINEGEAKLLTGAQNAIMACELIQEMGPKAVVIKRGEYGFILYAENDYFALPAFPIKNVVDPTGAGDSFAGGFIGYLAHHELGLATQALKQACVYGSLVASFTVQDFSVGELQNLDSHKLEKRYLDYKKVVSISH